MDKKYCTQEQIKSELARSLLKNIPAAPGVYRMIDKTGTVLYVGKAKNLQTRLKSYFNSLQTEKIKYLINQIVTIETTVTNTETEALLLECNQIKTLQPRFNILLRDDKSYPYLQLTTQDEFPRLTLYRGARSTSGKLFGPYPSVAAVRETLQALQKLFPIRQCNEHIYRNRTRPCLQYQIKRCSAPCVGLITASEYAQDVAQIIKFLAGRADEVIQEFTNKMNFAAIKQEFERAAMWRDRITVLRKIQEQQSIEGERGDLDLIASFQINNLACIQVFFVRGGRILGNQAFFPKIIEGTQPAGLIRAFLTQFYFNYIKINQDIPAEIIVTSLPEDHDLLEIILTKRAGHTVHIRSKVRATRARWLEIARNNAEIALKTRNLNKTEYIHQLTALSTALNLSFIPNRIECFDISHTQGENPVAACVVFDATGAQRSAYRRFLIKDITPGDDYAALRQALTRRYLNLKQDKNLLPDLILIDGGRGQLGIGIKILQELEISGIIVLGVAKGPERRPGTEQIWLMERETPVNLPSDAQALQLIIQIRDEAHRYAISSHRRRRTQVRLHSILEEISGVGPQRRQQLLRQFNGIQGVKNASIMELSKVTGIGHTLAEQIYHSLHHDESTGSKN